MGSFVARRSAGEEGVDCAPAVTVVRAPVGRFEPSPGVLRQLYEALRSRYGTQPWWPAESPFEVAVGAVLTQNAAWSNVERAIDRLKQRDMLSLDAILGAGETALADAIRPSGYYNVKSRRLHSLCRYLDEVGGLEALAEIELDAARAGLLSVNGIGPETADDILLYALHRPVFVIDTYTRRLLQRYRLARGDEPYDELRLGFEADLGRDVELFQQFHALIVVHAKTACRKAPVCPGCVLEPRCATGSVTVT
jgi:endonuclease-3 related protein